MDKRVDKSDLFERMPVKRAVLKQIVPTIVGQMIVLIYNLADTYFVGLLNEPRQTAAVTVVGPVFVMLTAVSNLFAVGGASVMAHALGLKDEKRARQVSSLAFWGGLIAAVIFSALFYALASPILRLCGATDETYALAFGYAKWVVIWGGAGTILNLLLGNLVRAEGGAMVAAFGVALGGVCNIILDPIFVLPQFLDMGAGRGRGHGHLQFAGGAVLHRLYTGKARADGGQPFPRLSARRGQALEERALHRLSLLRAVRADGGGGGGAVQVRLRL